eukprot:Skav210668  [mRNA]  locus=scaffold4685:13519:15821:- [translate_table: standard]
MQWAVVELAVERATGLDWPTAARKFLFQPLGISENTYYRSEDKPACWKSEETSIYETGLKLERNLRAGIGLCSTADDMFLLGITLRQSCRSCFLSDAGFAGYQLKDGWLLVHGGDEGYFGQNVLVQTRNGRADNNSKVLVTFVSSNKERELRNKTMTKTLLINAIIRYKGGILDTEALPDGM